MGIVLLLGFVVYMIVNVINMKKNPAPIEEHEDELNCELPEADSKFGLIKDIAVLIGSALVIAVTNDNLCRCSL